MLQNNEENKFEEQSFVVDQGFNRVVLNISEHSWISILSEADEIIKSKSPDPILSFVMVPGNYTLQTDGKIGSIISKAVQSSSITKDNINSEQPSFSLEATSDAPDQHIVDGIGEIPADGTSFCTITISKLTIGGTPLTGEEHQDEFFLRTTGGLIMDVAGDNHIRSLHLQSGQAAFRLVSEASPKIVTVTVFGREPNLTKAEIQIEFV